MADVAKYGAAINAGTFLSEFTSRFRTRRRLTFAYAFLLVFIAFTFFLAFFPSSNSSAPWFTNIFTTTPPEPDRGSVSTSPFFWGDSYRSHFSSVFAFFFPSSNDSLPVVQNGTRGFEAPKKPGNVSLIPVSANQTRGADLQGSLKASRIADGVMMMMNSSKNGNQTLNSTAGSGSQLKNATTIAINGGKGIPVKNSTKGDDGGGGSVMGSLKGCDMFDGSWVRDESYPLYKPGSCSLIDEQFNCFLNGRPDTGYYKLKWQPKGCNLPRLDAKHMLEMLRGKRLVFVGDSLNRNMWESLICVLKSAVKDEKKVYEELGRHHFRTEASYSFVFEDYKCTVEFFVSPFLVQEWEGTDTNGKKKETLRLDVVSKSADKYKNADIIVFNTGHWWTHEKTSTGKDYYQEGTHVYKELNVLEAFRKALTHWGRWVDANINPMKSLLFFRGYSASHFSGGQWNSGGQCDHEVEAIKNTTYLSPYPDKMTVLEKVLKGMKTPVTYLNVTRMTDYRKDAHPSIYRKQNMSEEERKSPLSFQDCSHWCLPGVPDSWNEILYAQLLENLPKQQV